MVYQKNRVLGDGDITITTDETSTKLLVKLIAFGGPENKDLHGHFFTKETYFGDEHVSTIKGFYNHLIVDNPHVEGDQRSYNIGSVKFVEQTEEGRWYEFEVSKKNRYHDLMVRLAAEKRLGASTGAFPQSVKVQSDGFVKSWNEAEGSLTPTPANPQTDVTLQTLDILVKSLDLPELVQGVEAFEIEITSLLNSGKNVSELDAPVVDSAASVVVVTPEVPALNLNVEDLAQAVARIVTETLITNGVNKSLDLTPMQLEFAKLQVAMKAIAKRLSTVEFLDSEAPKEAFTPSGQLPVSASKSVPLTTVFTSNAPGG